MATTVAGGAHQPRASQHDQQPRRGVNERQHQQHQRLLRPQRQHEWSGSPASASISRYHVVAEEFFVQCLALAGDRLAAAAGKANSRSLESVTRSNRDPLENSDAHNPPSSRHRDHRATKRGNTFRSETHLDSKISRSKQTRELLFRPETRLCGPFALTHCMGLILAVAK